MCNINQCEDFEFNDESSLLNHIENELLAIANFCRSYKFYIKFDTHLSIATSIIPEILQFGPIADCLDVVFDFEFNIAWATEISFDVVVNWLTWCRDFDMINVNNKAKNMNVKHLKIEISNYITNVSEMINGLKKVNIS